jgi:hypothetical protein
MILRGGYAMVSRSPATSSSRSGSGGSADSGYVRGATAEDVHALATTLDALR